MGLTDAELYKIVNRATGESYSREELQFRRCEAFDGLILVGLEIHHGEFGDGFAIYQGRFYEDVADAAGVVLKTERFAQKDLASRKRLAYRWFRDALFAYSKPLLKKPKNFPGRFHRPKVIARGRTVKVAAWFSSADGTVFWRVKVEFPPDGRLRVGPQEIRRL